MQSSRQLYPTPKVEFLVAEVYSEVIKFLRQSIKYFRRPGYCMTLEPSFLIKHTKKVIARLWQVISRPPQHGLKFSVDKLQCKSEEVEKELVIKLNERLQDVRNSLQDVQERVLSRLPSMHSIVRRLTQLQ